jgi:hypothetical protein
MFISSKHGQIIVPLLCASLSVVDFTSALGSRNNCPAQLCLCAPDVAFPKDQPHLPEKGEDTWSNYFGGYRLGKNNNNSGGSVGHQPVR